MSLLEYMDRTEWQLRDKLAGKGFSDEAVDGAVEYVKSFHYLDDLRYATHFVELHHEQRSIQRLRQDLYQRHVPEEYIEIALDSIDRDESVALQTALHKLTKGETQLSYEEKQKIAGKLYRKGFALHHIKRELDM
jgi:regulatory protein